MNASTAERQAMLRALTLAAQGPEYGVNPRVGCVILSESNDILGQGWHRGAGTPHAEAAALSNAAEAGHDVRGATAIVTLEPCAHQGRTGPCADALIRAGIARVVIAVSDPNPAAAGGSAKLRAAGVDVVTGVESEAGEELLRIWLRSVRAGRPFATLKLALSLDGRVAASDGSSRWITSERSRVHAHANRAKVDAIAVGTGTALRDDPQLTARTPGGEATAHQPLRVVVGHRRLPPDATLRGGAGFLAIDTHDVVKVLDILAQLEIRHLLVEGGPTLATAFLAARVVDQIHCYSAPVLLGAGPSALGDMGIGTIADAARLHVRRREALGEDTFLEATVQREVG